MTDLRPCVEFFALAKKMPNLTQIMFLEAVGQLEHCNTPKKFELKEKESYLLYAIKASNRFKGDNPAKIAQELIAVSPNVMKSRHFQYYTKNIKYALNKVR